MRGKRKRFPTVGRARGAAAASFALLGLTFGAWTSRLPEIKDSLDASPGALGLAFAAWSGAALMTVPFAGGIVERVGSRRAFAVGWVFYAAALVAIGLADGVLLFAAALALYGASMSFVDMAINAQGAHVERALARSIFSGLHALFSVGVLVGAGASALAVAGGLDVAPYLAGAAFASAIAAVPVARGFIDEDGRHESPPVFALPSGALLVPAALACAALLAEDVANTWSAVYAREVTLASAGAAALVLGAFAGAMVAGRLVADRLVARFGAAAVVSSSAGVCAAGFALAAVATGPIVTGAGFALVGLGVGPIYPIALAVASRKGARGAAPAMAAVSTVGSLGSLVGPPAVGAIGGAADLRWSMALVALLVTASAVVAVRLRD